MRRILIYGACHAQILRDLLLRVLPPDEFDLSLLVNFELIASGRPFPYAALRGYDTVIYSPIENQGEYNTEALRDACAAIGCQSICYPWLEWHGYTPGARKGAFKGRDQWHYPQLQILAENFSNFDRFFEYVVDNFPDDKTIQQTFETSTARLRAGEARDEVDLRIGDFIEGHFRSSRLFLICDHPSLKIYQEVLTQILVALQRPLVQLPDIAEPQGEIRTPIFPRTAQWLGLDFSDTDWFDHVLLAGTTWDLRTYLRLYYYPGSVILGPLDHAQIFPRAVPNPQNILPAEGTPATGMPAAPFARLFALPERQVEGDALVNYELLETLDRPKTTTGLLRTFAINPAEWRSTWIF